MITFLFPFIDSAHLQSETVQITRLTKCEYVFDHRLRIFQGPNNQ